MKTAFIIISFLFLLCEMSYTHDQLVHKYIVWNGWQLVKDQHNVNYTVMNNRIGPWSSSQYNSTISWLKGYVVTGAFIEDEEDVMYNYSQVTSTHFWDPEIFECDINPDNTKFIPWDYCYENSLVKSKNYWRGKKFANDDWLLVKFQVISGPNISTPDYYQFALKYDDLANVYKYNQIYVTLLARNGFPVAFYNPPRPFMDFNLQGGTRSKIELICWEIIGRICHLLGDAGVPAHTHNDPHPPYVGQGDSFESWMKDAQHYDDETWQDAKQQAISFNQPTIVDVQNVNDPLKFLFYTTDQLADRLPSDDYDGDYDYTHFGPGNDNYEYYVQPIMNSMTSHWWKSATQGNFEEGQEKVYPFSMRTTAGFLWYVFNKFAIVSNPPPIISTLNQAGLLCPGSDAYISCNLTQGGEIHYVWTPIHMPSNVSIEPIGDGHLLKLHMSTPTNTGGSDDPRAEEFQIRCYAYNDFGNDQKTMEPAVSTTCSGGGCPWVYVFNSDSAGYVPDNNILHRSEFPEYSGLNIKDLYKLQVQPSFMDNNCSILIKETEDDTNYYNQIKLYAIDHPIGTSIGITENNDIIMYNNDIVESTDDANLNGLHNITSCIQYYYQGKKIVTGNSGDSIYAHYDEASQNRSFLMLANNRNNILLRGIADSLALIAEIGNYDMILPPNNAKDYAGNINIHTITDSYTRLFSRRENLSNVIVPFADGSSDAVNYIDVNWNRDYQVTYFSVVPVMYSGFEVNEMSLTSAALSDNTECIVELYLEDTNFVKLDSSMFLNLKFENVDPPASGTIRDYVIDVKGRYTSNVNARPSALLSNQNNQNIIGLNPIEYKLYLNYPNPFNPRTLIRYDLAKDGIVKIVVYDLLGRVVKELVNNFKLSGSYDVEFDATNLASGIYIYKIESNNFVDSKKMVLIK